VTTTSTLTSSPRMLATATGGSISLTRDPSRDRTVISPCWRSMSVIRPLTWWRT